MNNSSTTANSLPKWIEIRDLPWPPLFRDHQLPYRIDRLEEWAYARALKASSGNRRQAIVILGIAPATFYRKARAYGLISERGKRRINTRSGVGTNEAVAVD